MQNKISMFDYNCDWAMRDCNIEPRPSPGYLTREEVIQFYGTLGIDGVDIRDCYWGDWPVAQIKTMLDDNGLKIVSYENDVDLALPSPVERSKAVDRVKSLLDRTAELGAGLFMLFPGCVKEGVPTGELKKHMIEALAACAAHAESIGVTVGFENIDYEPWRPLHGTSAQCRQIIEQVDSPALRFILDACAALFVDEHPVEMLKALAPYLVHVHLKNSRPVMPGEKVQRTRATVSGVTLTGTVLDGGLVEIPAVLDELKEIGYDGYLMIEYQGEVDPRPALKYNLEYLRKQMEGR